MFKRKDVSEIPYSMDMLPRNRKEMWFDVAKLHYTELILLGLIMFVFFLPLILNTMVTDIYTTQLSENEQWTTMRENLILVKNTSAIINIPALVIASIGVSGLTRIIRQYAWGEVVSLSYDFVTGIKQNGKQTALLAFVSGVVYALCIYLYNLAEMNENVTLYYASSAFIAIAIFFLLPIGAYMLVCISVYGNTFAQNFIQSFFIYIKALWKTLLALLLCGGILFLNLIPSMVVHFTIACIFILGSSFILLGWFLFVYNRLDEFVNKEKHPEIVNKGLYSEEE